MNTYNATLLRVEYVEGGVENFLYGSRQAAEEQKASILKEYEDGEEPPFFWITTLPIQRKTIARPHPNGKKKTLPPITGREIPRCRACYNVLKEEQEGIGICRACLADEEDEELEEQRLKED